MAEQGQRTSVNAIVCFGTPNCADDIRYLYGALRGPGKWEEAVVIMLLGFKDESFGCELMEKGAMVFNYHDFKGHPYRGKYLIYQHGFNIFNKVLYLDLDYLVLKPVKEIFEKYNREPMYWDKTPFGMGCGVDHQWLKQKGIDPEQKKIFQASGILFDSRILKETTYSGILAQHEMMLPFNVHNNGGKPGSESDEPIQNLYWSQFTEDVNAFRDQDVCFVGCRNANTVLAHTTNWHKPWQSPDYKNFYREAMEYYAKL